MFKAQETAVEVPDVIDAIWQSLVFYDGIPVLVDSGFHGAVPTA